MRDLLIWGGWAVAIAAVAATTAAWRHMNRGRLDRARVPSLAVSIRKPMVQDDRWQLRLEVTNVSIGHRYSLRATVINSRGMGDIDGRTRWVLPWQHAEGAHELSSGASEILVIGAADANAFYPATADVQGDSSPPARADWPAEGPITLEIMVVDPGQDLAFHRVLVIERESRLDLPPALRWA